MVLIFEVEDKNTINIEKLADYYGLYLDHLDPLGWGMAIIGVDRWGARRPIPYFDYVFSEMIDSIPDHTLLSAIKSAYDIEQKFAEKAVAASRDWDRESNFELIRGARRKTRHGFWRDPRTQNAHEFLLQEK